jgi:nucleoside-diphosphate-sugar epimerase
MTDSEPSLAGGPAGEARGRGRGTGTVLLTGHRGFIGGVVHRLLPEARVLETRSPDAEELQARLEGVDCLIHLAGGGGARFCREHPREAVENNVLLTRRLASAARRAGVRRFVYASSIAVYGTTAALPLPVSEDRPAAPDDLYGSLKWACEELLAEVPHVILRLANVYGLGTGARLASGGFVNQICRSARETRRITLTSATLGLDLVHVTDVARAILRCASTADPLPPLLNIGGGRATTLVACAELVRDRVDVPVELVLDERPGYRTRYLDISRAREALDWSPTVELADGIDQLLASHDGGPR